MKSNRLKVALFSAGLAMSISVFALPEAVSAQALSTDKPLAGISLILDKFCGEEKIKEVKTENVASARTIENGTVTDEETQKVKELKETEKTEKKESKYADMGISIANNYVNIRRKPNTESRILGKLYKGSAATIIKRKGEWVKIKSGSVTGWINSDFLAIGFDAEELEGKYGTKWATITTTTLFVREKRSTDSAILTMVPIDETFQVKKEYGEWVKIVVDEGDEADSSTVGFVSKDYVDLSVTFEEAISIQEEKAEERRKAEAQAALEAARAEQAKREQQQQSSVSSSNTSSSSSSSNRPSSSSSSTSSNNSRPSSSSSSSSNTGSSSASGSAIASFAQKFIGNPYVYGGTSLTNGADCSGFTQSVFRNFGISIPRTSASQAGSGKSVSVSSVQPGDLIFYARNGRINHVALYIGGGQVVHASNERTGIKTSNMYYRQPSCARRYW